MKNTITIIIFSTMSLLGGVSSLFTPSGCVTPPLACPNENVTFWLYTRTTQNIPHQLNVSDSDSIKFANFASGPFKVLVHGYTGHKDYDPNTDSRPAYLRRGEYNVISLDYEPIVRDSCYFQSVQNVQLVARCTAQLIDEIVTQRGVPLNEFHVVSMSLGTHVAGAIGRWLTSGKLERITGLDPALPLFVTMDNDKKLDKSDAKFVDIIHTNALGMGKLETLGHVDFFVNGGLRQNGCDNTNANGCSHKRAPLIFAESINTDVGFYGRKCQSWIMYMLGICPKTDDWAHEVIMGEFATDSSQGLFFVNTNPEPPYAQGPTTQKLYDVNKEIYDDDNDYGFNEAHSIKYLETLYDRI